MCRCHDLCYVIQHTHTMPPAAILLLCITCASALTGAPDFENQPPESAKAEENSGNPRRPLATALDFQADFLGMLDAYGVIFDPANMSMVDLKTALASSGQSLEPQLLFQIATYFSHLSAEPNTTGPSSSINDAMCA